MKRNENRIISALATLAVAVAGAALALDLADHDPVADAEPLPAITQPVDPTTTTTSSTTTTTIRPSTTTSTTVVSESLGRGDTGPAVADLQRRLRIAVHGYHSVPPYPASHGCVRVTEAAMDWIWANDVMPMGSTVWVH